MKKIFNEIILGVKSSKNVFFISAIIFVVGLMLGIFLNFSEDFSCYYKDFLISFLETVLSKDEFGVSYLFKRILTYALLLLLIAIISLNKYTYYLIFAVLFYRAYILGLALKLFITELLVNGALLFLFLVFFQAVFLSLSIIVFISLTYKKIKKIDNCALN